MHIARRLTAGLAFACLAVATSFAQQAPSAPPAAPLPKVLLLGTGGTISNRAGGRMTVDELIKSIPNLERFVRAEGEQVLNVASGQITMDQWLDLSRRANDHFKKDAGLAGLVVTSGTDTLEELAYFLHLTVRDPRPVVVVGAMRNPSTLGYEGAANLEDAFRVAADPQSKGMGVLVVLNDEINSAREVTKTDSRLLSTFTSRDYGVLGTILDRVVFFRKPVRRHTAQSEFDVFAIKELPRVDVILTYQGAPGDIIKAAVDAGAKGIVIAGAGAGATSGTQGEGTRYALEKGVFVVTTTRAGGGGVPGGGRGTSRSVSGDDLLPVKARILLMLALATSSDPAEINRMFREY
jgi:L-asparaginase